MINWKNRNSGDLTLAHFGLIFLLLATFLIISVATYWVYFLEPQINNYSRTQSNLIAQSQSWILADTLDHDVIQELALIERMDEILILSDEETEAPYIYGISIELEDTNSQPRIISRGTIGCQYCFVIKIPLYSKLNYEIIGLATFYSNNDLFNFLKGNIRSKIIIALILITLFIAIAWMAIWKLINKAHIKDKNLSTIFNTIPFPMIISDSNLGNIIYYNQEAKRAFNIKDNVTNKIKPRDFFSDLFVFNSLDWFKHKSISTTECPVKKANDEEIWSSTTIAPITFNNQLSSIITIVDITDTKKARDEIDNSKKRFATIVDGLEDFFYVIRDNDQQIMFSNISENLVLEFEALCSINTPVNEKQIFGQNRINPASHSRRSDDIISSDFFNRNNGRWYSSRQRIISWIDGQLVRLVTITDITNLKNIQIDLATEKDKAEVASRVKSEFLATMSHEIRTPMNGIISMLNLLKHTSLTKEQLGYLNTIDISSEQLLLLVNDILDISKIESGKLILENNKFKLSKLCNDSMRLIESRANDKKLKLRIDIHDNTPNMIMGDEVRLRQVLINLLGNAVKFTDQGSITLSVKVLDKYEHDADLLFSVIDTGIGIPENKQHLLFEKFSQLDSSISRKYGGSGLGLAISKKLVDAMNGEIGFKNNLDTGTTFYFTVRLSISTESSTDKPVDIANSQLPASGLSILLAEDNDINSFAAKSLLEKDGHTVVIAKNGKEAINTVSNSNNVFDVILMDLHMPEIDGIEACKRIRALKDPDKQSTPIIALTASIMQDEKQKCIDAGMNGFVIKPFTPERLNAELAAFSR